MCTVNKSVLKTLTAKWFPEKESLLLAFKSLH